jgi:hypothetical protein
MAKKAARPRARPRPLAKHDHTCIRCSTTWACTEGTRCQIDKAATVNREGPYCTLCFCLEEARRIAWGRNLVFQVWWSGRPLGVLYSDYYLPQDRQRMATRPPPTS